MGKTSSKDMADVIVAEHEAIEDAVKRIRRSLGKTLGQKELKTVKKLVSTFKDRLTRHFKLEEDYGLIHDLVFDAPRIECSVRCFCREHRRMSKEIRRLCDRFRNMKLSDAASRKKCKKDFDAFVSKLKDHESRENELILEVHNIDLGAGG